MDFHVLPYALSDRDQELEFALPKKEGWLSGSLEDVKNDERDLDFVNKIKVEGRSLKSIMCEYGHDRVDLLKLDIEGSEFSVLEKALDDSLDIRQMCIDHHEHMFNNGNDKLKHLVNSLHKKGYIIFYAEQDVAKCRSFSCIKSDYV